MSTEKRDAAVDHERYPTTCWTRLDDGRIRCDLCPRVCALHEGQTGLCCVRMCFEERVVFTTYGRSSGFCIDPIEKKPLNHFLPGTSVLSFGTAGCNLSCRFCQNWDISKSREMDRLADAASPERIADAAVRFGCRSVAFTYNDPVIFMEYAIDVADAYRERGVKAVAVNRRLHERGAAGGVRPPHGRRQRAPQGVHRRVLPFRLRRPSPAVLETLEYLVHETSVWVEITNLPIPGLNDTPAETEAMSRWIVDRLGSDVPVHFTAFHPDWKLRDRPATPAATLTRARDIARASVIRYAYTGNVHIARGSLRSAAAAALSWSSATGTSLAPGGWTRTVVVSRVASRALACSTALPDAGAPDGCPSGCVI